MSLGKELRAIYVERPCIFTAPHRLMMSAAIKKMPVRIVFVFHMYILKENFPCPKRSDCATTTC